MGETRLHFCCTCGAVLNAAEDSAALAGECPACGKIIIVPDNAFTMPDPTRAGGPGGIDGTDESSEIGGAEEALLALAGEGAGTEGIEWPPEPGPGLEDDEIEEAPEPLDDGRILGLPAGPGRPGEVEAVEAEEEEAEEEAIEALVDAGDPEEVPVEGAFGPPFDTGEAREEAHEDALPGDVVAGLDGPPGAEAAVEIDLELDAELDVKLDVELDARPDMQPEEGTDEGAEEGAARRPTRRTDGRGRPSVRSPAKPDGKGASPAKMLVIFALVAALAVAIAFAVITMTK